MRNYKPTKVEDGRLVAAAPGRALVIISLNKKSKERLRALQATFYVRPNKDEPVSAELTCTAGRVYGIKIAPNGEAELWPTPAGKKHRAEGIAIHLTVYDMRTFIGGRVSA